MKLSEQYEQSAIRNDRSAMIFGGLAILHGALLFSDKLLLAILHGVCALFFAGISYVSWDIAKIDRMISESHRREGR